MPKLPEALTALTTYKQFILFKLVPNKKHHGKMDKLPVDYRTLQVFKKDEGWQQNPEAWTDAITANNLANLCGPDFGVGFFFTPNDPFFFLDIDNCKQSNNTWSPIAITIMNQLPGAAIEVSQSGNGLHIFGTGKTPDHGCKNDDFGLEFYTQGRFVALTGFNAVGDAATDCSEFLPDLVKNYFPPKIIARDIGWTTQPLPEWISPGNNEELIDKALNHVSAAHKFGKGGATFRDLWENNIEALSDAYPPISNKYIYDQSTADQALAQHLAFWTGCNCEHILNLMWCSKLVRDKWVTHKNYLTKFTIMKAVSLQKVVYTAGGKKNTEENENLIAENYGAKKLKGSKKQNIYAEKIREEKLNECYGDEELIKSLCAKSGPIIDAKFWIENQHETPQGIAELIKPLSVVSNPITDETEIVEGYQFYAATQQVEHFKGCTYIQDENKVLIPTGSKLDQQRFNATYGGYIFQLDDGVGGKTTKKAWEAFTESQIIRYKIAESTCFRPDLPFAERIKEDKKTLINTYLDIDTPQKQGDMTKFFTHLNKLLPKQKDREILLAYMAAVIQYKGVKFQWCPLLQGAPGNGKTLFSRCVAYAIGERYTHWPRADQISEKFNDWLFDKIFIAVEDVFVAEHKQEVIQILLPMITNDRLSKRAMLKGQEMYSVCANFMLNMNKRDGWKKTKDDRRYSLFFTAQQTAEDIIRDGMNGDYFPDLYDWLKGQNAYDRYGPNYGYSIVNEYLTNYKIPAELNPARACHRAPVTSTTDEAIYASLGGVEQEIIEAIDEGRLGFNGGWVSSMALDALLKNIGASRRIPQNKRRELLQSLGYDWHPALHNGRVNNLIKIDGGKPKLYVKLDTINALNLKSTAEVVNAYIEAQSTAVSLAATNIQNRFNSKR